MQILKYRKKPVVIEAFQMTQDRRWDTRDWPQWLKDAWKLDQEYVNAISFVSKYAFPGNGDQRLCIHTLEGLMMVDWNDWIIRGVKGELYPCKPNIFAATYDPVEG